MLITWCGDESLEGLKEQNTASKPGKEEWSKDHRDNRAHDAGGVVFRKKAGLSSEKKGRLRGEGNESIWRVSRSDTSVHGAAVKQN